MRALGIIAACIVVLIAGAVVWYVSAYPAYTYRFRLAIAVDVAGETKMASSVIEVRNVTQPMIGSASPVRPHVYGDAVFMNLGTKGNIAAILGFGPDGTEDHLYALVLKNFGLDLTAKNLPLLETLRGSRELVGGDIPTLVTFSDINDENSARVVRADQFEEVFGPDVHFKRAWIEMTNDSVTRGIETKLLWWDNPRPWLKQISGGSYVDKRTGFRVNKGQFKKE